MNRLISKPFFPSCVPLKENVCESITAIKLQDRTLILAGLFAGREKWLRFLGGAVLLSHRFSCPCAAKTCALLVEGLRVCLHGRFRHSNPGSEGHPAAPRVPVRWASAWPGSSTLHGLALPRPPPAPLALPPPRARALGLGLDGGRMPRRGGTNLPHSHALT